MKLQSIESLKTEAVVSPAPGLTKRQKLERWAEALEARGEARLATLWGVEYAPRHDRLPQRQDDSPLAVAFADPVLRAAGLKDDTYGAALDFFELNEAKLHRLTCRCQFGSYVAARRVANRVRAMAESPIARLGDALRAMVRGRQAA